MTVISEQQIEREKKSCRKSAKDVASLVEKYQGLRRRSNNEK